MLHDVTERTAPIRPMDYTFTGQIKPMKLVFFDLRRVSKDNNETIYSDPKNPRRGAPRPGPTRSWIFTEIAFT